MLAFRHLVLNQGYNNNNKTYLQTTNFSAILPLKSTFGYIDYLKQIQVQSSLSQVRCAHGINNVNIKRVSLTFRKLE